MENKSENLSINDQNYFEIIKNGNLYDPAYKHYGNTECIVNCNRCYDIKLSICYGYDNLDLCLNCYNTIKHNLESETKITTLTTLMEQDMFHIIREVVEIETSNSDFDVITM